MKETVLVADDEEDIRDLLALLLMDLGFQVIKAGDGSSALSLFQEVRPSIVLTDIKMPGMDGIQLLKRVKAEDKDVEVIMISGHGDLSLAIESLKYEAADFITKPIDDTLLAHALQKAQEKIHLKRDLRAYTENLENLVHEKSIKLVELERQIAASQVLELLSSGRKVIAERLAGPESFPEIPYFISMHNNRLEVVTSNELYRQKFGHRAGARSWDIYKGSDADKRDCPAARAVSGRAAYQAPCTAVAADGSEFPVMVYAAPIAGRDDQIQLVLEIGADISFLKRLQDELLWTQKKFQHLFDEVPCYVTVQDRNLRITEANRRFKEDFGFEPGMTCYEAYKHRHEPCPHCPILKTFEDGRNHQAETLVTARSGEHYNTLIWTAPLTDPRGEITHVIEMSTNITQIRQLQDHIASLGMMLGSMSHGMRGLLTALDGGIYRMESGLAKQNLDEIHSGWDMLRLRIDRIRKMILDVLYYAKSRDLDLAQIDLHAFISDLEATTKPKADKAGVRLMTDFTGAEGAFEADATALSSALVNFLENAVDACQIDGAKKDHTISFSARRSDNRVVFEISDNGIGMDQETKNNIFTLFFSSKGSRGTGIGLFISNQVVNQHHGRISVESEYNRGTSILVEIPCMQPLDPESPGYPKDAQRHELGAVELH